MPRIVTFITKGHVEQLREKVVQALNRELGPMGLVASLDGRIAYSESHLRGELQVSVQAAGGRPMNREARQYNQLQRGQWPPLFAGIGWNENANKPKYIVIGYRSRARKYKILCESTISGNLVTLTEAAMKALAAIHTVVGYGNSLAEKKPVTEEATPTLECTEKNFIPSEAESEFTSAAEDLMSSFDE